MTLPPLVKEVVVATPVEKAWAIFTAEIDTWWPVETHSIEPERVKEIVFEAEPGGRVFERWHDGTERAWGQVEECEPPHRVLLSWQPNHERPAPTEVEVAFTAVDGGTRVRLEQRGWERLGDQGAEARSRYVEGWDLVLGRYAART